MTRNSTRVLRRMGALLTIAGISVCLAACAEEEQEVVSSPRQELNRMIEFVVATTQELGIDGWYSGNGASRPDSCSFGGDHEGTSYSWNLSAQRGVDRSVDAHRVADYWRSLGMKVDVIETNAWPMVFGEGGPVAGASFETLAGDDEYFVGAEAYCTPGYYVDFIHEDNASRRRGDLLPGDEFIREGDFPITKRPPGWHSTDPTDPPVEG